jgi:hypothetical protein
MLGLGRAVLRGQVAPPGWYAPEEHRPFDAKEETAQALMEATYWLHFGRTPEKALPWLTHASGYASTKEDFDDLGKYDAEVKRLSPEKWKAYHGSRLKISMERHPRSIETSKKLAKIVRGRRPA